MRSRSRARKTLLRSCCYTIQIFQSEKYDDLKHTFLPTYTWLKETLKLCSNISITLWPANVNIFLVTNFIRLHSIKRPSWQLYSPSPWGEGVEPARRMRCAAGGSKFDLRDVEDAVPYNMRWKIAVGNASLWRGRWCGFSRDGGREKGSK